jgi:NTP pyrophosphatase (non-canonical NTP hydrolase)
MARNWKGPLEKTAEECNELCVELMKLSLFPDGNHPGRRRNVLLSTEDELADVLAAVNYFIDSKKLDRKRIDKRIKTKTKKFEKWWGDTPRTRAKKQSSKAKKR